MGATALALTVASGLSAQTFAKFTSLEDLTAPTASKVFSPTFRSLPSFADINNDGFLDIYYGGQGGGDEAGVEYSWRPFSSLNVNNGNGTFTPISVMYGESPNGIPMNSLSNTIFFDYNNDGLLDVIIQSTKEWGVDNGFCQLYKNLGNNKFELVPEAAFRGGNYGNENKSFQSIAVGDLDKDGFLDIATMGKTEESGGERYVEIYRNNGGDGTFTKLEFDAQLKEPVYFGSDYIDDFKGLHPLSKGSISFGDLDNDGWLDIVVNGYMDGSPDGATPAVSGGPRTKIYKNQQDGTFKEVTPANFQGNSYEGTLKLADFNNDGFLDIFVTGWGPSSRIASIMVNDGAGGFDLTDAASLGLNPAHNTHAVIADLNHDGRLDIITTGEYDNSDDKYTTIFYQRSNGQFRLDDSFPIVNVKDGGIALGDYNNDNVLDVFISGAYGNRMGLEPPLWAVGALYTNDPTAIPVNEAPSIPANLTATPENGKLTFAWEAATDDITEQEALVYNIFVKDTKTGTVFSLIPADLETGRLKATSYVQTATHNLTYTMNLEVTPEDIATGRYLVGVQAIDQSLVASKFAKVTIGGSSIDTEVATKIEVTVVNDGILVKADSDLAVSIADLSGRAVATGKANSTIAVNAKGIYLVTVAGKTYKVIK